MIDAEVPAFWRALGIPGLADIHVHFMPKPVMDAVWRHFDDAPSHYGTAWPCTTGARTRSGSHGCGRWACGSSLRCCIRTSRTWRPG